MELLPRCRLTVTSLIVLTVQWIGEDSNNISENKVLF